MVRDSQEEKWKCQLQEIERKEDRTFAGAPKDAEEVSEVAEFAG